jgi:hypothetical protein
MLTTCVAYCKLLPVTHFSLLKVKSSVLFSSIIISTFYIPPATCLPGFLVWCLRLSVNREALEKGEAENRYQPLFDRHVPQKACRLLHPSQELNLMFTVLLYLHNRAEKCLLRGTNCVFK